MSQDVEGEQPLVSLIILTYERLDYLKEALASAINQTYTNLEIIVSDNCSQVNPEAMVASFQDARVRFRRNPTNLGQTWNYLVSLKEALGKYVCFLNDDDLYDPDFITKLVGKLEADNELVLAFSDHYIISATGIVDQAASEEATRTFKKGLSAGKYKPFYLQGLIDLTISGMDTLFRRDAIDWGAIPPDLPGACDLYMVYLFACTGQGAYYCPERLTSNRVHPGQSSITSEFPKGLVRCFEQFLSDERLSQYRPVFQHKLAEAQTQAGIALLKEKKPREARRYLKAALRHKPALRVLGSLVLSFIPVRLLFPAIQTYKGLRKMAH
jgi:glycosyltransferase involved in cell wall biosynthesis